MAANTRNSNFELLRLVAMFLVIGVHANFLALGPVTAGELQASPAEGFSRTFLEAICLVCVDVFVLISGWFGIRTNPRRVLQFAFIVLFWRWMIALYEITSGHVHFGSDFLYSLVPGQGVWFTVAYAMLLALAPMVNPLFDNQPRRTATTCTLAFLGLVLVFGYALPVGLWQSTFDGGFSAMGVFTMYLIGRMMRLWSDRLEAVRPWVWYALFFGCALLASACYCGVAALTGHAPMRLFANYISPLVIVQSVSLFMIFSKLSFRSAAVNNMAKGVFAVYLIHCNPYILPDVLKMFENTYAAHSPLSAMGIMLAEAVLLMSLCLLADVVRQLVWREIEKLLPSKKTAQ